MKKSAPVASAVPVGKSASSVLPAVKSPAPTGRAMPAQAGAAFYAGNALGLDPKNMSSPEGAKEGDGIGKAHQLFGEQLSKLLDELNEVLAA